MPDCAVLNERLWIEMPGEVARAHRVEPIGRPHLADVAGRRQRAILVRTIGRPGDGSRLVPIAELTDARPLGPAEIARYDRLDAALAGRKVPERKALRAFYELLHRRDLYGEVQVADGELAL